MEELTPYVAHGNSLCEIKGKLSVSLYYCKEMYYANPCNSSLAECFIGNIHGYEFFSPPSWGILLNWPIELNGAGGRCKVVRKGNSF